MFKRFGILSLVLAGATLCQPAALFAGEGFHRETAPHDDRRPVAVEHRENRDARFDRYRGDHIEYRRVPPVRDDRYCR